MAVVFAACGGEASEGLDGENSSNGKEDSNKGGFGDDPSTATDGSTGNTDDGKSCVAQAAQAERKPVYIYFLFDKSGSMGDGTNGDPNKKWYPVTKAFTGFVGSARAEGIEAALTFFPNTEANSCATTSYEKPAVPLTALPNATPFTNAMPDTKHLGNTDQATPTLPALKGLLPVAKANADAHPEAKTIVVLITDGSPMQCSGNNLENIGTEIEKYKESVSTYVILVGISKKTQPKWDVIAEKGGSGKSILVDVGDPTATEKQLFDTIDEIRLKSVSCELDIPAPPSGQTLDFDKINVSYTPGGGAKKPLGYDAKCESDGWRFDDASKPTKIVLCTSLCDAVKEDPKGAVDVEFGCARRTSGVN